MDNTGWMDGHRQRRHVGQHTEEGEDSRRMVRDDQMLAVAASHARSEPALTHR